MQVPTNGGPIHSLPHNPVHNLSHHWHHAIKFGFTLLVFILVELPSVLPLLLMMAAMLLGKPLHPPPLSFSQPNPLGRHMSFRETHSSVTKPGNGHFVAVGHGGRNRPPSQHITAHIPINTRCLRSSTLHALLHRVKHNLTSLPPCPSCYSFLLEVP